MTARMKTLGIDRLSPDERLELIQEIYESLDAEHPDEALSDGQREELDRRLATFSANPATAVSWEVVEAEALARIRK
ncbi:MAG: addiction module protein [Planctomycetota bacterium]